MTPEQEKHLTQFYHQYQNAWAEVIRNQHGALINLAYMLLGSEETNDIALAAATEAANRFDHNQSTFSTYAAFWVRKYLWIEIQKAKAEQTQPHINTPRYYLPPQQITEADHQHLKHQLQQLTGTQRNLTIFRQRFGLGTPKKSISEIMQAHNLGKESVFNAISKVIDDNYEHLEQLYESVK